MRLQTKILIGLGASLLLTGLVIASFFGARVSDTMIEDSKANLYGQLRVLGDLIDAYRSQTERLAIDHFSVLNQMLVGEWQLSSEQPIVTDGKSFPSIRLNGKPLNNDFTLPDRFTQSLGSVATIFVRSGDDFARVSTSLKNKEGQRAVGTLLDRAHPAYALLLGGTPYVGRANLFGRDYMTRYEPLRNAQGAVIGALFIGVDFTQSFSALKNSVNKMRIGQEGYFYAVDTSKGTARGTAVIHPNLEGKNLFEIVKDLKTGEAVLEKTAGQPEGFVEYAWKHTNKGEMNSYAATRSYSPWNLQLYAKVNEDEILGPARKAAFQLGLTLMLTLAAITVFAVWLVSRLVIKPLGGEPEAAADAVRRIARGDLGAELILKPGDQTSLLFSLKGMQEGLRSLVSEIRNMTDAAANRGEFSIRMKLDGREGFMLDLADLLNQLSHVTETGLQDISRVAQALAQGDLSQKILQDYPGLFGQTTRSVNQTVEALSSIVAEIQTVVAAACQGDFSVKLNMAGKQGYTEDLGRLLNQLSDVTEEGLQEIRRVAQALAAGDLTQTVTRSYPGIFGQTTEGINHTVENLKKLITEIQHAVQAIDSAAQEIASGNRDLSSRTEEQASSLEETASSMEELNSAVKQNVSNANEANELAQNSNEVAKKGGEMVHRVVQTMSEIQESSKRISDILVLIESIAFQTNILALNAAVEAARAGEQGRGFAVVASEVRNLAQRSAAASKDIKNLISASLDKVECGSKQVRETGATMEEVVSSFFKVANLVANISDASREQGAGIEQVTKAVEQMDEVTQQNAALVEQATAAAESLEDQSHSLMQAVARFRLDSRPKAMGQSRLLNG